MRIIKAESFMSILALFTYAQYSCASTLNITAEYKGSATQTGGVFTNTTNTSGECEYHKTACKDGGFSILFPWPGNNDPFNELIIKRVQPNPSDVRSNFYLGFDGTNHKISVSNGHDSTRQLNFSVTAISWSFTPYEAFESGKQFPPIHGSNCRKTSATGWGDTVADAWHIENPSPTECWINLDNNSKYQVAHISWLGIIYKLKMDNPWEWEPGVYEGTYHYALGQGKDLDLGSNVSGSFDDIDINFTVTVIPDMYVKFWTENNGIVYADLQPSGGWLKWSDQMPPYLEKDIELEFGSTGPVKMHLVCEHAVGDGCGIVDQQGGNALGVDTLLTAHRLIDDTNKPAQHTPLSTKDRIFTPDTSGGAGVQPAHLLFKTQDGVTVQMKRGHQYGGLVTIVFDANV